MALLTSETGLDQSGLRICNRDSSSSTTVSKNTFKPKVAEQESSLILPCRSYGGSNPLNSVSLEEEEEEEEEVEVEVEEGLDPELWRRIPTELLERIVAKLPVTSILRFRSVCRRWNEIPFDKKFHEMQPHLVGACPPFLSPESDILYIEGSGKWKSIPFHFLPSKDVILEASGGGLLLLSKSNLVSRLVEVFFICNPITREWFELTRGIVRFVSVACIDVDHHSLDFSIVVAGWIDRFDRHMGRSPLIEIYDSTTRAWSVRLDSWDDNFFQLRGVALLQGTLYLAVYSRNFNGLKVLSLHIRDRTTKVCGEFGDGSKFHCFGQYRGNLTAVVQRPVIRVIEIWQLKQEENAMLKWVVVDRLAEEKLSAFSTAAIAGGFLFFNYYDEPIALYDLRDQSWQWVDFPPGRKYWVGVRPLAFQPSFVPLKWKQ